MSSTGLAAIFHTIGRHGRHVRLEPRGRGMNVGHFRLGHLAVGY
jgi:hypothetical protein